MRAKLLALTVFGIVLLLAGIVAAANISLVSQYGRKFSLATLQIARGGIVHFSNEDRFVHQVYIASTAMSYESNEQPPGTSVEISFPAAGTFEVRCHIHPKMLLSVDVR